MTRTAERGATLVEFIFACVLILFTSYATLEITHILTFKNKLHTVAVDISHQVAHQHLYLQRLYDSEGRDRTDEWLRDQIETLSQRYFASIEHTAVTPGFRIKPVIVMSSESDHQPGVYLQVSACYSFLFAGSLSDMSRDFSNKPFTVETLPHIPKADPITNAPTERNCFGEFSFQPNPQMVLYERTYTPWPANTALYDHGVPEGTDVRGVSPFGFNRIRILEFPTSSRTFHRELPSSNSKMRVEASLNDETAFFSEIVRDKGVE